MVVIIFTVTKRVWGGLFRQESQKGADGFYVFISYVCDFCGSLILLHHSAQFSIVVYFLSFEHGSVKAFVFLFEVGHYAVPLVEHGPQVFLV